MITKIQATEMAAITGDIAKQLGDASDPATIFSAMIIHDALESIASKIENSGRGLETMSEELSEGTTEISNAVRSIAIKRD